MGSLSGQQLGIYFGAELLGMLMLVLLGNGVVASVSLNKTKAQGQGFIYVCFGWLAAIFVGVLVSDAITKSGGMEIPSGLINPIFAITNMIPPSYANGIAPLPVAFGFIAILGQIVGAAIGQLLVIVLFKKHYDETSDSATILGTFSTGPAIRSYGLNFVTEAVATMVLVIGVLSIGRTGNNTSLGALNPALLVFAAGICLGSVTGFSLNPTRDIIPRLIHQITPLKNKGSSDWAYSWVPVAGPILGGLLGMIIAPGLFY